MKTTDSTIPFNERIACTVPDAMRASGIGQTKIYELMKKKRLKSTKVDGRRLVLVASLRQLIEGNQEATAV